MSFSKEFIIGPDQVKTFADLVGDHNPLHLNMEFAQTTKYGQTICHGMLVAAYISGCLVEAFGQGTVYVDQNLRFRRPVPVGSCIRVLLGEPEAAPKGRSQVSTCIEIKQDTGWKSVLEGQATIIIGV